MAYRFATVPEEGGWRVTGTTLDTGQDYTTGVWVAGRLPVEIATHSSRLHGHHPNDRRATESSQSPHVPSNLCMLGQLQSIIHFDAQIAYRTLKFGVTQQKLNCA